MNKKIIIFTICIILSTILIFASGTAYGIIMYKNIIKNDVASSTATPDSAVVHTESSLSDDMISDETIPEETTTPATEPVSHIPDENNIVHISSVTVPDIKDTNPTVYGYGKIENPEKLKELETILDTYIPEISVVAISLIGDRAVAYNTNASFFSACTVKMGYVLNCCKIIEKNNIDINTKMIYQEKHYHGGSGEIRYQPYGTEYTLKELLTKCLYISDNVAYEMLLDYFGLTEYNKMVEELGCDSLHLEDMWITYTKAKDLAIIWQEVDKYFKTNTEMAKVLKDACTNSPYNWGTLEIEEDYSHKSGDNKGTWAAYNDAGIVWHKDKPYVYVVLTHSEGTWNDKSTVNNAMSVVYDIMTK